MNRKLAANNVRRDEAYSPNGSLTMLGKDFKREPITEMIRRTQLAQLPTGRESSSATYKASNLCLLISKTI